MNYKWIRLNEMVKRLADGACIPATNDNLDWVAFQKWLAEGNAPQTQDPPTPPDPRIVQDESERVALKGSGVFMAFVDMTPAQIDAWVNANVTTLAEAREALKLLAKIVNVAIRRQLR